MPIVPEFHSLFEELQAGYLEKRERLNACSAKKTELASQLAEEIALLEPWRNPIMARLGEIGMKLSPGGMKEHGSFVRKSTLWKVFQEAPCYHQIINKPEGYAGDAEMMRIIYQNAFEGETPFGKFVHKQATQCSACQAVRNRRTFLREQILQVKNSGGG